MQLPSRIPNKTYERTRPDFDVEKFRELVLQKGLNLEWQQTLHCPCYVSSNEFNLDLLNVNDEIQQEGANPNCPTCSGEGLIRHSSQEIRAIITHAKGKFDTKEYGTSNNAEIKLTLLPEHLPSFGDRFTMKNSVIVRNEILTYSGNATMNLSYPIITRDLDLSTGIQSTGILSIYITDANGLVNQEVDLSTVSIGLNGELTWNGVNAGVDLPINGGKFAIQYYTNPVYVVTDHPHTLRDTFKKIKGIETFKPMPVQCLARLENV